MQLCTYNALSTHCIAWDVIIFYRMNKINYPGDICFTIRSIFTEMTSMNSLIVQSLNQVQRMVDADRASLFLIDTKTNQLYAK